MTGIARAGCLLGTPLEIEHNIRTPYAKVVLEGHRDPLLMFVK